MTEIKIPEKIPLTPSQEDFLKKEAGKLNSEVEKLLEETRSREKYSLTIIAGVAVWVFTHLNDTDIRLLEAISLIPFIITLIYGISVKYLYDNIKWIGIYLLRIENYFLETSKGSDGNPWGWEKYFDSENRKGKFVNITWGSWILQVLLAIALFILVSNKDKLIIPQNPDKSTNAPLSVVFKADYGCKGKQRAALDNRAQLLFKNKKVPLQFFPQTLSPTKLNP